VPEAPPRLTQAQVEESLKSLPDWSAVGEAIQRTYEFGNFSAAMQFVSKVAEHAEAVQHHPDIMIRYSKVTLTLSTHDSGGITQRDIDSARYADELASTLPAPPKPRSTATRRRK
jgi:4a-hydroxytetrahydrobiopterin dehydratase